ncbi:response regulator [Candidatus Falkowbacteria bacterium]|nr:response regulator [Candidatus Falkowbacteria bacterium]
MDSVECRRLKILVIDDEPLIRTTLRRQLGMIGLPQSNIFESANAAEGFLETVQHRPDVVFCDIHMPMVDGFHYLKQVRKSADASLAATPVIMLTGDASESSVLTARSLSVNAYLVKPVSTKILQQSIERTLKATLIPMHRS